MSRNRDPLTVLELLRQFGVKVDRVGELPSFSARVKIHVEAALVGCGWLDDGRIYLDLDVLGTVVRIPLDPLVRVGDGTV